MRIEGSYKFHASREMIWSLLQDPATIAYALPGCEALDQATSSEFSAAMRIAHGPFEGLYQGQIHLIRGDQADRLVMDVHGTGPTGAFTGHGALHFEEQEGSTLISYAGDVEYSGSPAAQSPRMILTTANSLIRQFFEAFDRQVRMQTGVHTTSLPGLAPATRPSGNIDMEDVVATIKQDRRTLWFVLVVIAFFIFSVIGALVVVVLLVRWGKRLYDKQVEKAVYEALSTSA